MKTKVDNQVIHIVKQDRKTTVLELITEDEGINTLDSIKQAMKASEQVAFYEDNGRLMRISFMTLEDGRISVYITYRYYYSNKPRRKG